MSRLTKLGYIDVRRTTRPVRKRVRSRGIPPALADREIFYTEDVREAADLLSKTFSPLALDVRGVAAKHFAATAHGVRLRNVSLLYVDLAVAAIVDIPSTGRYFAVHMPTNGRLECTLNGHELKANTTRSMVTSPGMPLTMHLDQDSPQLVVRIEEEALVRHLTRLLGRSLPRPVVFDPELDLTSDAAMRWNIAVQLLHAEVFYPGSLVRRGQGIGSIEELIMSSLLLLQPSNYHAELVRPEAQSGRRVVRETMDYIEAHLQERITMDDIARHVHMSVRSVQQGFREELGTTPMLYLKERRLERVHEDLTDAIPADGVTVTDIAERWGFHHLGSFSVAYRKRWGESPSETLRK